MPNLTQGHLAEDRVAEYLAESGYKTLARNWKTKDCEIDIIAKKEDVVYFVEGKYRVSGTQGTGFDYITPKKLDQMRFAARVWAAHENWGGDYRLMASEVPVSKFERIEIIEL